MVGRMHISAVAIVALFAVSCASMVRADGEQEFGYRPPEDIDSVRLRHLTDDTFEHATQAATGATTGDWLVAFCDNEEDSSDRVRLIMEKAQAVVYDKNFAYVDYRVNPDLVRRFKIVAHPTVLFFTHGKVYQLPYRATTKVEDIRAFLNGGYLQHKFYNVPDVNGVIPGDFQVWFQSAVIATQQSTDGYLGVYVGIAVLALAIVLLLLKWSAGRGDGKRE